MTSKEIDGHDAAARVVRARIDGRRTAIMLTITLLTYWPFCHSWPWLYRRFSNA